MSNWRDLTKNVMESVKSAMAETVTYTPNGGSPIELQAVCDEAYQAVDPNTSAVIMAQQPMITIALSDLESPPGKGDEVVMRGETYKVIESQTDGQAAARLFLHKA